MTTYNGEKFLQEQLDSFLEQTKLPDELVVCDDGSTDASLHILEKFQNRAPFLVKIYCNVQNLGSTKNFEKAIRLCSGEVIFLSDQDDVWLPKKVERLTAVLEEHPEYSYIFSDVFIVDEALHPLGYTMWEHVNFTHAQRKMFSKGRQIEVLLKHNVVTGMTMAFRAEIKGWVTPFPENCVHDAWIALLSSASGAVGRFIEDCLVQYRQHTGQLIGGQKLRLVEQFRRAEMRGENSYKNEYIMFVDALERLTELGKLDTLKTMQFKTKIAHLKARQQFYHKWQGNIFVFLKELFLGRYHRFSNGWKAVAKDLFLSIGHSRTKKWTK
jgi:glycosyltransferase involved in cell wall biosynthesis